MSDNLTAAFVAAHPKTCAYKVISKSQLCHYLGGGAAIIALLCYRWDWLLSIGNLILCGIYFTVIFFKLIAIAVSGLGHASRSFNPDEIATLDDEELPIYTIFVPLYKEAEVASKLLSNLGSLDYPTDRLDIKILLEEDDRETIELCRDASLPPHFEIMVVPEGFPKTKPRACNYGLQAAKGEFGVIYDAEDRPDVDQLKKALLCFRAAPTNVACVQAQLNFYNPKQNILTRWFTVEYTTWFDMFLPGLQQLRVPIPLGGTSNHFRNDVLRELGGWDPYNVTEDCDLGVRIHEAGYRTQLINSTTWEEANPRLWNWIRQRSRWIKGYLQTHLAHMRHPFSTFRALGPWAFMGFLICVGGLGLTLLLNIIYWGIALLYGSLIYMDVQNGLSVWQSIAGERGTDRIAWQMIFQGPLEDPIWSTVSMIFFAVSITLTAANIIFITQSCIACIRRGYYSLLPAALLSPLYWLLISIGAWKGFIQLLTNPFYWEKTDHGLD